MELYKKIQKVESKDDLVHFIHHLKNDLLSNKNEWENKTLENYLEAMAAWIQDSDGYQNKQVSNQPTWKTFADILYASRIYE